MSMPPHSSYYYDDDRPNRRPLYLVLAVLAVIGLGVGAYLFQPWKAFVDTTVDEDFPAAAAPPLSDGVTPVPTTPLPGAPAGPEPAPAPTEPVALASGNFANLDKEAVGTATAYQLPDGQRVLRLADFRTSNGPDLFVYLVNPAGGGYEGDFVNLGVLKGNVGNQNYEIPADVDLNRYSDVVIWCKRFTSAFGAAPLAAL